LQTIEIRNATVDDIPDIVSLYNLSNQNGDISFDAKIVGKIFKKLDRHTNYHFYVAAVEKRVVGTFMLIVLSEHRVGEVAEGIVENIAVHKKFQRQGVGTKMMDYAIGRCRDANCSRLVFATSERMPGAYDFLESIGFRCHGYRYVYDLTS
jgi:GNAT superfamily N-acetyltransferase